MGRNRVLDTAVYMRQLSLLPTAGLALARIVIMWATLTTRTSPALRQSAAVCCEEK